MKHQQQQQQEPTISSTSILQLQQQHLDDTDVYASVWQDAIQKAIESAGNTGGGCNTSVKWGGRGKGGRGIARRTLQLNDICIPDGVRLEYVGGGGVTNTTTISSPFASPSISSPAVLLLENARLNLLSGHTYGLIGKNGCGKSSLLRRIDSCKIPGFPFHITTLLIQQETAYEPHATEADRESSDTTTLQTLIQRYQSYCTNRVQKVNNSQVQQLEGAIEQLDVNDTSYDEMMNEYMERISSFEDMMLENDFSSNESMKNITNAAIFALEFVGIPKSLQDMPFQQLTIGQQSKVSLSLILLCCTLSYCDLLLIDEITSTLDIQGLIQLRCIVQLITTLSNVQYNDFGLPFLQHYFSNPHRKPTTIVLVSHDYDFLNDVVTDVIEFHIIEKKLYYYSGNYNQYVVERQRKDLSQVNQIEALQKKETMMQQTLNNIRNQPVQTSRGAKKKAKSINCQKKKIEKEIYNNPLSTIKDSGSVQHVLRRKKYENEPDKLVQFQFRNCTSHWNEPLIVAIDIGHTFQERKDSVSKVLESSFDEIIGASPAKNELIIKCKDGYLFDTIDLCIEENCTYCIMGESGCGKSTLLQFLAKRTLPTEGTINYTHNVNVAYVDFSQPLQDIIAYGNICDLTTLQYLMKVNPTKTEHEIRSELSAFGLGINQAQTTIGFLSGGEQCRLSMVLSMLQHPFLEVLCLDHPTANLDVESVDALIYGLQKWNGTIIMVCHDAYFIRSLEAQCFVLTGPKEGKLRRVQGGIDEYIRSFGKRNFNSCTTVKRIHST
jgi:ATPase subunit of ABC transporter with duplicated ATPase domains